MASGTTRVTLNSQTPTRLDNQGGTANLFVTVKVLQGSASFLYQAGTTAPAAATLDKGYPKEAGGDSELIATMNAADSLWGIGNAELAIISRVS